MATKELKVLLIIEQCNPEWSSVPLEGYNYFQEISKLVNVTLVTHGRNKEALEKISDLKNIIYISESNLLKSYYSVVQKIFNFKGVLNWPLFYTLTYPIYADFNNQVFDLFKVQISRGDYDIVHAITPTLPRYPVKAIKACGSTPFILGPVNGGVPFPKGFKKIARQEFAYLNFLRTLGRALIPDYVQTYKKADKILAGSTFTLNMIRNMFKVPNSRIELFYENGINKNFFKTDNLNSRKNGKVTLLFVGRLVPYKCADIVIESISKLEKTTQNKIHLIIVGDGSEKSNLQRIVQELNLSKKVNFVGWVSQQETLDYYRRSDIFCFPSVKEFGGAVVLEAMACGLPCIVANNGGIGEYVTEETGFKIEPLSRKYLIQELANKIETLVKHEELRKHMSVKAIQRVQEFEWGNKARKIVNIYEKLLVEKNKLE